MLRFAVISECSPFDRKGLFNAVHNRIRHLIDAGECEIDAYCIHSRDTAFTRRVRHTPVVPSTDEVEIEGIRYRILWYDFSIIDHVLVNKLYRKPLFFERFMSETSAMLKDYDCIMAHSFTGALFASEASRLYGIPYFVTWHGSDIHTHPWRNPLVLRETERIMRDAECNFFVSHALMADSDRIASDVRKEVLYNGVSEAFVRYPDNERERLRSHYGLSEGEKVVAFAGSIVAVKNVKTLQPIFHEIRSGYEAKLKFWIIGDGKLREPVEKALISDDTIDVKLWGNVPSEEMPSMLNCVDVLLLPSLNEGLGMICAEALKCGAAVAGSDTGGIPEVIGHENTVPLDDDFVRNMALKAVEMLKNGSEQQVPETLDWKTTAALEMNYVKSMISR